ncbi:beta-lactamase family protein [Lujinxingia vulgaris]|uniref:Beta-lactamase family protein n=1 Tax=Lujinxingia vulgaris TaxID=2600176 RepID=A0A5C6X7S5_9DELT|nr:serine hydrolase domain-containing protein [Lujinxingia vulgaris]TXD34075.1 beta-lactamase family protein [Lujinxingia vulgaris]
MFARVRYNSTTPARSPRTLIIIYSPDQVLIMVSNPIRTRALLLLLAAIALSVVILPAALVAQTPDAARANDLQRALEAYVDKGHTRGAVAWRLNADGSEEEARVGIDQRTADARFEAGSITKVFSSILLADAVLAGKVTLETPIAELFPRSCELAPEVGAITLKELSTHTSGLPRQAPGRGLLRGFLQLSDPYAGSTREELFEALCTLEADDLKTRGSYSYSNFGVALLGRLLEAVDLSSLDPTLSPDATYETRLDTRVLQPLGLTASDFEAAHPHTVPGHRTNHTSAGPWHLDAYNPAGGLRTTLPDLIALARNALAADFPPLALTLEPHHLDEEGNPEVGLGWFFQTLRSNDTPPESEDVEDTEATKGSGKNERIIWHNGRTGGYFAFIALAPESGRAVVLLTDTSHGTGFAVDLLREPTPEPPPLEPNVFFLLFGLFFPWLAPFALFSLKHRLSLKTIVEPPTDPDASFWARFMARQQRQLPAGRVDALSSFLGAAFTLLLTYQLGAWQVLPIAIWYAALALTVGLGVRVLPVVVKAPWFGREGWKGRAMTVINGVISVGLVVWVVG